MAVCLAQCSVVVGVLGFNVCVVCTCVYILMCPDVICSAGTTQRVRLCWPEVVQCTDAGKCVCVCVCVCVCLHVCKCIPNITIPLFFVSCNCLLISVTDIITVSIMFTC